MAKTGEAPARRVMRSTRGGVTRPVLRAESRRLTMTKAKREEFLATLAESANVKLACETAGVTQQAVYKLRRREEGFAAAWVAALDEGYAKLETMTLDWAMNGVPKETTSNGRRKIERHISERLALSLLTRHGATVAHPGAETLLLSICRRCWTRRRRRSGGRTCRRAG